MTALRRDIKQWFREGVSAGCTHLIIVYDILSHDSFPVYVFPQDNVKEVAQTACRASLREAFSARRVEAIYNLGMDREEQLGSPHVMNF